VRWAFAFSAACVALSSSPCAASRTDCVFASTDWADLTFDAASSNLVCSSLRSAFALAKRVGQEFQRAAEHGFEAASRSFAEINRDFQAIATEMTDFSKKRLDDVLQSWEQLLRARSLPDVVEVQTRYAQKAYDAYMSEFSKLGEMYLGTARDAAKPIEQTSRKFS
jgi:hypothetical protein